MPGGFKVLGHRGARGLFPENTLEGFVRARALGVQHFEIDVAVTADDVPVLSHDPVLNPDITRGPDGMWLAETGPPIRALRLGELVRFDVGRIRPGTGYARRYPAQQPIDGARIPTLEAVLRAVPDACFTIELKTFPDRTDLTVPAPRMAELVVDVAAAVAATERIRVQSFDWRGPRHLGRIHPEIARAWLTEPETVAKAALWWGIEIFSGSVAQAVVAEGGEVWAPEYASITAADVEEARTLGLAVIPWTVNDVADMQRLTAWGVGGLITDRPDVALGVMADDSRAGVATRAC